MSRVPVEGEVLRSVKLERGSICCALPKSHPKQNGVIFDLRTLAKLLAGSLEPQKNPPVPCIFHAGPGSPGRHAEAERPVSLLLPSNQKPQYAVTFHVLAGGQFPKLAIASREKPPRFFLGKPEGAAAQGAKR